MEEKKVSEKTAGALGLAIKGVLTGFSSFSGNINFDALDKAVVFLEKMANAADPIHLLANSLQKVAQTMDKFAASFKKMNVQTVKTFDMFIKSLVLFAKVDPNAFNTLSNKGQDLLNFVFEKDKKQITPPPSTPIPTANNATLPGNKPLVTTPATPAAGTTSAQQQALQNQQMMQMIQDLNTALAQMASTLKGIQSALMGTLKVETT